MVAEVGYIGSKGHNLPFYGDPNTMPSRVRRDGVKRLVPGATLRYPELGPHPHAHQRGALDYQALTRQPATSATRAAGRRRRRTRYGNSNDTWSGGQIGGSDFDNGAGSATDWWDPEYEYGPSSFDIRHTLVVNGVYVLPFGQRATGL